MTKKTLVSLNFKGTNVIAYQRESSWLDRVLSFLDVYCFDKGKGAKAFSIYLTSVHDDIL